ncbi:hypothetical protein JIX56_07140 [Streptomyces sp. CA-210063]|uniref:hypothetical protein n=1 Tax=Streptomyces sp. CA-210063 TaxID=2801029 RepID=UPI00214C5A4F|nr:hypothetical protein [Streptomyces sp. CA-210063]UUU29681.1 hypothetical protein JIX56_07140 [Streptomyces sp. CA-210063]
MASWQWNDQNKPTPTIGVRATAGAVTVKDNPQVGQRPYVFVRGSDSRLHANWWDGGKWQWSDHGVPAGRTILEKVGSVTVRDTPGAAQRPYTFVIGDDSKLYANWWDGSQWHWADHGAPSGRWVREGVGVVVVQDSPTSPERPYAFVLTDDFRLWCSWWDGSTWHWADHGTPPSHTISRPLGVTTVRDTPSSFDRPYAYVITADSHLWCSWWDGNTWHWADHGTPAGQPVKNGVGVITVQDTPNAAQRPYVFVQGYDSKLYLNWWDGGTWHWSAQGTPSGRLILDSVGAITVRDAPTAAQRPYAYVIGDNSKLYANWWDGSTWKWADHGTATGRVLERPGEVLTVQDNNNAAQRPYAFLITDDSELWVNWWSLP